MPMIQELQVRAGRSPDETDDSVARRRSTHRVRARYRWVIRSTLMLVLVAAVLCGLLVWRRDVKAVAIHRHGMQLVVIDLQKKLNATGYLPSYLPESTFFESRVRYYASPVERDYARQTTEPVLIARSAPIPMKLREDGFVVIIYENKSVRQEWLPKQEFERLAKAQHERIEAFESERKSAPPDLP